MKYFVFIPSRYDSVRLSNKSLLKINNEETLIENVFSRCLKSKLAHDVYVVTDSLKIKNKIEHISKNIILTDENINSGTDRVYEGAKQLGLSDDDFVINVQGDQAMLDYTLIDDMISAHKNYNKYDVFTFASKEENQEILLNENNVKVVLDKNNKALYFSRSLVPYCKKEDINNNTFYKHIGIYGYTYKFLKIFTNLEVSYLEKIEKLEQLRALENGFDIQVIKTNKEVFDINTKKDLVFIKEKYDLK